MNVAGPQLSLEASRPTLTSPSNAGVLQLRKEPTHRVCSGWPTRSTAACKRANSSCATDGKGCATHQCLTAPGLLCSVTTNHDACIVVVSLLQFKAKRLLFNHAMDVLLRLAREEGSCMRIESPYLATIHGEKQYATANQSLGLMPGQRWPPKIESNPTIALQTSWSRSSMTTNRTIRRSGTSTTATERPKLRICAWTRWLRPFPGVNGS